MSMDICILGGTGFVGSHLVARLAADGHRLRVPSRNPARRRALQVVPRARLFHGDVHDEAALAAMLQGCDAAINLVGVLNAGRGGFRRAHVELPRKLAQAARSAGVPRVLQFSALGADAANGPSRYLRSKGEGEAALRVHAGDALATTIFRPSVIFGPGDSFLNRFAGLMAWMPLVFPLARADARFQPVYVGDVVEAVARTLGDRAAAGRRYTLCGPETFTLRALVALVARLTGRRRRIVALPDWLGRLQATAAEWLPGTPFSRDNFRSLLVDNVCDGGGDLPALDIEPQPLDLVAPRYLGAGGHRNRLSVLRSG